MKNIDRIKEELLVIRCIEGDRQAFEEIVELWQQRLHRHAYQLTGEEDAAWEAVQETWAAVTSKIRKLHEPAAFGGWIYRILGAKCADWIRQQQKRRKLANKLCLDSEICNPPTCDQIALKQALMKLSTEDREILSLRYAMGYSTVEVAEILRIPEGTVKSRLYKAREDLKRLMEESYEQ